MCPPDVSPPENSRFLSVAHDQLDRSKCSHFVSIRLHRVRGLAATEKLCFEVKRHFSSRTFIIEQQYLSPTRSVHRKEVIQPHLPIRLPCYDFTPVIGPTFDSSFLTVRSLASGVTDSHGVTGGVYKTRERIHRNMLICDY